MSKEIIVQNIGAGFSITIPSEILAKKAELLASAKSVVAVTSEEEQKTAIQIVAKLKGMSKTMEATREEVKKPFLKAGDAIQKAAKEFSCDIDSRVKEIEKMVGEFQRQEREKAEAARREEDRKRQEAEAAAMKAQEDAEKARLAAKATNDAKAKQAALEAEFDAAEAQDALAEASAVVVQPPIPKAQGASVRVSMEFTVTDEAALYRWDTEKWEDAVRTGKGWNSITSIQVSRRSLGEYINSHKGEEIPGVTITETTKAAVRASY